MISARHLRVLKNAGIGIGAYDVQEWADALSFAMTAGVLRIGSYNVKQIDGVTWAWCSRAFTESAAQTYTHGDRPIQWLSESEFRRRAVRADSFIKLPIGHPVRAIYDKGKLVVIEALSFPGEYEQDVTDSLERLFPSGVDEAVSCVYAVVSSSESSGLREAYQTSMLLTGSRGFVDGIDNITLSWVDGMAISEFIDFGVMGALSEPTTMDGDDINETVDFVSNSRCVLVAVSNEWRCALQCSRLQYGEMLSLRTSAGPGRMDTVFMELDTGDVVCVSDLLALAGKEEGSEVCYVTDSKGNYVLSDEYGNALLGAYAEIG